MTAFVLPKPYEVADDLPTVEPETGTEAPRLPTLPPPVLPPPLRFVMLEPLPHHDLREVTDLPDDPLLPPPPPFPPPPLRGYRRFLDSEMPGTYMRVWVGEACARDRLWGVWWTVRLTGGGYIADGGESLVG